MKLHRSVTTKLLALGGLIAATAVLGLFFSLNERGGSGSALAERPPKLTVCHATGSESNPYVEVTVSEAGAAHHLFFHEDDFAGGNGETCPPAVATATATVTVTPPFTPTATATVTATSTPTSSPTPTVTPPDREFDCFDGIDNDEDGLTDFDDLDCID